MDSKESKVSDLDREENEKVMKDVIFDENKVQKSKLFVQDKLDEETFYHGLLLPKEDKIKNKAGEVIGTEQIQAPFLITSNHKIIEATRETELNYKIKFEATPSNLPLKWSLDMIEKFLKGDDSVPELTPKELAEKIEKKYKENCFYRESIWYKVNALWDMGTYLFSLFDVFPIKEERGLSGTGKTKTMNVSKNIAYNSTQILINPSTATLFRETNDKRPTKYIDEAEKLFTFKRNQMESDDRVELINGSYSKCSVIPRMERIGINKYGCVYYNVYSPTRIGSINGLYGATEGRAITQIHTRSSDSDKRGEIEPQDDDLDFRNIRDYLYWFSLKHWKEIENNYRDDSLYENLKIKKRDLQLWKSLLAIAKTIGDDWFDEISKFAEELSEMKLDDFIAESSFDYMVLKALKEAIEIYNDTDKHYIDNIKEIYCKNKSEEERYNIYLNRNIAQHLSKLGFNKKRDGKGTYLIANKNIFDEIVAPICPQLSFLSTSSTLSTQSNIKLDSKSEDNVKIDEDKSKEKIETVKINVHNVDDKKMKEDENA